MKKAVVLFALLVAVLLVAPGAFAQDANAAGGGKGALAIAAGFGMAIAAFGAAFGQGKVASSACEGIARNPAASGKLFVPMIIGLALIESLVIYAFLVTFVKIQLH